MSKKINPQIINERLRQLRQLMQERGICVYVVPTSDDHISEYVGEHYKCRSFITGFTGSAGTAVVTMTEAGVWTDGRYFVQAAAQVDGSEVTLYRMGEPEVPTVTEFVEQKLCESGVIGFDGSCMAAEEAEDLREIAEKKNGSIAMDENLIDLIWEDRPALPMEPVFILRQQYAGESTQDKLLRIREEMKKKNAASHLIGSLYDIAWITNMRGGDISHVPVFLSFLFLTEEEAILYAFSENWSEDIVTYLNTCGITLRPYTAVYDELPELVQKAGGNILLNPGTINAKLMSLLTKDQIVEAHDPSELMRSIKNETEVANTIEAHIHDGVAVTKFIHYLKTNIGTEPMTEISASDYLQERREEQPGYLDLSFDTISAYGANAAMMHYSATPEDYATLAPEGMLLVDSGGHYLGGTTDITRTIVLGPISDEIKKMYTLVLKGHLRLAHAKFPKGVSGTNLDVLAREPLWELGLDYRCGTGHGVGHILNVHEGPNAFRWRTTDLFPAQELIPGMITTNEPGFYEEGGYGIRIENELLCVEAENTEYGQYYQFQNLTFAPIDLDAVLPEMLTDKEKDWLNAYHRQVYDTISPYLDDKEKEWLQYETRAV